MKVVSAFQNQCPALSCCLLRGVPFPLHPTLLHEKDKLALEDAVGLVGTRLMRMGFPFSAAKLDTDVGL